MTSHDAGIANGDELLEAIMRAARQGGYKHLSDLLAGKDEPGGLFARIREEVAKVCHHVGLDMEATRAEYNHLLRQWGAVVQASGIEPRMEDCDSSIMTASLCKMVRRPPTNLERVTLEAVRGPGTMAEAFAKSAKETGR